MLVGKNSCLRIPIPIPGLPGGCPGAEEQQVKSSGQEEHTLAACRLLGSSNLRILKRYNEDISISTYINIYQHKP
jgi:hypothetical protein